MRWIVQNHTKERGYEEMIVAIQASGSYLKVISGDFKESDLDDLKQDSESPIMFLGSIEMCRTFRALLPNHKPLIFNTAENYLCSRYYSYFGGCLFNDQHVMVSLAELRRRRFLFYGLFGKDAVLFVRPDSGQKPFSAGLVDLLDLDGFCNELKDVEHGLVLISTPKNIRWEGRFVVSARKEIIAHSTYRYQGQLTQIRAVPAGATELVAKLLDVGYHPDQVYVMDLCEDNDGNFWLLELNSFTSSGLYECDKAVIVDRVTAIVESLYPSGRMAGPETPAA